MVKKELDFAIFCIENIAEYLKINGTEAFNLLTSNSNILNDYILENYEPLHTQGKEYIVNDIICLMKEEGVIL